MNPFLTETGNTNPFASGAVSRTVAPPEQDVIFRVNNPSTESPRNFGFVEIPATIASELDRSILTIPREAGSTLIQAGELLQAKEGKSVSSVATDSFMERLAFNMEEGDTGVVGLMQSFMGAEKDAILQAFSTSDTAKQLQSLGGAVVEQNDAATNWLLGAPKSGVAADIGSGLGSVLKSLGAWFVAKNPAAAGAYMTFSVNSGDYIEARKADNDPEDASSIAAASALGQGKLEGIGMGAWFTALHGSSFLKKFLFRTIEQGAEEGSQAVVEETVKGVSGVRDTTLKEKMYNIGYQATIGLIVGAPVSAIYTHAESAAAKLGLDPKATKNMVDTIVAKKDDLVSQSVDLVFNEISDITKDAPNRAESVNIMKKVIADKEAEISADESTKQAVDTAKAAGKTADPIVAAQILLDSPTTTPEVKAAIQALPRGYTMNELQAVAQIKQDVATAKQEAVQPILDQQKAAQQKQLENIQSEMDDDSINLQRDAQALIDSKEVVDPETLNLLESTVSVLKEQRKTKNPVSLSEFIKSKGGLKESDGELQSMGIKNRRGIRNDKTGINFDDAALYAYEQGYFDERPTMAEFLAALRSDLNGYSIYTENDADTVAQLDEMDRALTELDQALGEKGIGTNFREKLKEMQKKISENKKIDKLVSREAKIAEMKAHRLEAKKQSAEESPPKILADKLKTFIAGMRKGGVLQKQETAAVQSEIIRLINESGIEAKDKAKFISTLKNTQTVEQLEKRLGEITSKVEALLDSAERKKLISQIQKAATRIKDSGVVSVDFGNRIMDMVKGIDLKTRRESTINAAKRSKEFFDKNPDRAIPSNILDRIELLDKKKLEDITTQELAKLHDDILVLEKQGKVKLELMNVKKKRLKEKRIAELQKDSVTLDSTPIKQASIGERLAVMERIKNKYIEKKNSMGRVGLATNPMDVFFDMLDNNKSYKGANYRIFKQTIDDAFSRYLNLKESVTRDVKALADKLELNEQNFEKIGAWAVLQQEGGKKKLLDTGFAEADLDALSLNESEMKMYNLMRVNLDSMLPAIQEVMRTVYNKNVVGVSDYFPFMTDHEAMKDFEIHDQLGPNVPSIGKKKNVEKGFTISRTKGSQKVRIDALGVFLKHVDNATYLIEMGGDIKALGDVAQSKEYGKSVGDVGQEMVVEWINLLARKGNLGGRIPALDAMRRNVGFAFLGYKLSTVLIQPTALADGAALVGGSYVAQGVRDVTKKEWRQFIWNNMPEVRERIGDDPAYLELGGKGIVGKINESGFYALKKVDHLVASSIAIGAYTKSVEERGGVVDLSNPDPVAIQDAQRLMRRTQSSAFAKDSAPLLTQGALTGNVSLDKIIFQFQSFMLNRWSLIKHDMWEVGVKNGNTAQALNVATWMIIATAAEIGIRRLSKEMIAALTGDDPDPWEDTVTKEAVITAFGNVPFVSQVVSAFNYGSVPVPAIGAMVQIGDRLKWAAQSKSADKKAQHYTEAFVLLAGAGLGVAGTLQVEQIIRAAMKKDTGKNY